jgi:hypothetical protein
MKVSLRNNLFSRKIGRKTCFKLQRKTEQSLVPTVKLPNGRHWVLEILYAIRRRPLTEVFHTSTHLIVNLVSQRYNDMGRMAQLLSLGDTV